MSLTATLNPLPVRYSLHRTEAWVPELLLLRFVGDECVERIAGSLWRPLFDSRCSVNFDVPQFLHRETIQFLLAITHRMSAWEVQIRKVFLGDGRHRRLVEVQLTTHSLGESVMMLRDITRAARHQSHYEDSEALVALLSAREIEVLALVVHGTPNKTIAVKLKISVKTVEKHRTSIVRKTGTGNSAELIRRTYPAFHDQHES